MTESSSPWYGALYDLLGKALPALKGLPSSEWSNNPEVQQLKKGVEEGLRQRPDPSTEQGKVLSTANQLARMQNDWQQDSNATALKFGDGTLDQYGRKLNMNLNATNAARDNFTGNTQKLESTQSSNRISEAEARARMSMMPVEAYVGLVDRQERSGLEGLRETLESRERLQRDANAAANQRDMRGHLGNLLAATLTAFSG